MFIVKYKKIFFTISGLLVLASIASVFILGLDLGIDFTGGSILEIEYQNARPTNALIGRAVGKVITDQVVIQPTQEKGVIIKMRDITKEEKAALDQALSFSANQPFTEISFNSIGPVTGGELARKGLIAIALVIILIILFIAFAFRGVSHPVSSWKYGIVAIVTLCHDIAIPVGVMAVLSHYTVAQVDALFLTALLAILGLSVNDTIVIFDRIRENLRHKISPHFSEVVGMSLNQTFVRSINTSLTVIIVLLALLFLGGDTTKVFALILAIGMIVGTYSSIFVAAPLLVVWQEWKEKKIS